MEAKDSKVAVIAIVALAWTETLLAVMACILRTDGYFIAAIGLIGMMIAGIAGYKAKNITEGLKASQELLDALRKGLNPP